MAVRQFVAGLLAERPRTNRWTIAEHVGDAPYGPRHLLGRVVWVGSCNVSVSHLWV